MNTLTRLARIACQAIVAAAIVSCGGDGGDTDHPPSISNLDYSPSTTHQVAGGTVAITGTVDFADAGGDVASLQLKSGSGEDLTVPTPALSGSTSGTATGTFVVSVDKVGSYTFEVRAKDARGSVSNVLAGKFEVLPRDASGAWEKLGVSPPNELYAIAWNGSRHVAVGANGTAMSSSNLGAWAVHVTGVTHTLRSVASSGFRFVAVGENAAGEAVVLASADGTTWSVQYRAGVCQPGFCGTPSKLSRVIWTGTQFVAVGQELVDAGTQNAYALVLTSPDGLTWTRRADMTLYLGETGHPSWPVRRYVTSVAWSGGMFAMLGMHASSWDPMVWTSVDADQWVPRDLPYDAIWSVPLSDVTWGNGRFVAVGPVGYPSGPVFTSTDGVTWQVDSTIADLPAMNAIATGANEYLAVGGTHRMRSSDGLLWTATPMTDCGNGILWDGSRYVAVGAAICRSQ